MASQSKEESTRLQFEISRDPELYLEIVTRMTTNNLMTMTT